MHQSRQKGHLGINFPLKALVHILSDFSSRKSTGNTVPPKLFSINVRTGKGIVQTHCVHHITGFNHTQAPNCLRRIIDISVATMQHRISGINNALTNLWISGHNRTKFGHMFVGIPPCEFELSQGVGNNRQSPLFMKPF